MPCDTKLRFRETRLERKKRIAEVIAGLEQSIQDGRVKVTVGPQGAVAFLGWVEGKREAVTDACAFRKLEGSWIFKQALAKAEVLAGRKVNVKEILAGVHSHDGGKTWGKD